MLHNLISIFFPDSCILCDNTLIRNESNICLTCISKLPQNENSNLKEKLSCLVPIQLASSFLKYEKYNSTRNILHHLKYKKNQEVGYQISLLFGQKLLTKGLKNKIDYFIPVPLHPKKLTSRGYNQCDSIAKALQEKLGGKVILDGLTRKSFEASQTKKSKWNRWIETKNSFQANPNLGINMLDKHIAIVDDVITTGATIESCANALITAGFRKISVLTLACAT